MSDRRIATLRAALGIFQLPPRAPELRLLHRWLDTGAGAVDLPWQQRFQLAGDAPVVVRLDTRTGELRVYAVGPQQEIKRVTELGGPISITEVARWAPGQVAR